MTDCPCGSSKSLADCCGPYLADQPAPTAEATMRSRYSAHVLANADYLQATLSEAQRADFDKAETEESFDNVKWMSLEIRQVKAGGEGDDSGEVEFVAKFRQGMEIGVHHERAYFAREDGRWVFTGADLNPKAETVRVTKVGRNEPCPCGSGKKYKKCCGKAA